ncbi:hypothetical protein DPMN_112567, partial [Dreissena polymorpha]
MESEKKKLKHPISSASAIMHRHDRKQKKWYRRFLPLTSEKSLHKQSGNLLTLPHHLLSETSYTRSLEDVRQIYLAVPGVTETQMFSELNLSQNDDNQSDNSLSSAESDCWSSVSASPKQRKKNAIYKRLVSENSENHDGSSESEMSPAKSSLCRVKAADIDRSTISDSDDSSWALDLPPRMRGYNRGSTESINSQCEARHTISRLLSQSDSDQESTTISNRHLLMQNAFHQLDVWLQEGQDLVIRDSCGTSDPYVKFKCGNKQLYKSRIVYKNLNPNWDERFSIPVDNVLRPIQVKVFDYDRGPTDDPMGSAELILEDLAPNVPTDVELRLAERGNSGYMGVIRLQVTLIPRSQEEKEKFSKRSTLKIMDKESAARKLKLQMWTNVVTIVLVEGRDLIPMDDNGLSDPYVKFKLGNERYKSKHKDKTLEPRWLEQFDLRMFPGQTSHLEIVMYDKDVAKDDFMGRAVIDLSKLEKEITHSVEQPLEDGAGLLKLLITISGTSAQETISDLSAYSPDPQERLETVRRYGLFQSLLCLRDVGWLQVQVFKAQGLIAADIGGKSDPFCVLELVNARLQTHTEYKTLNPEWNKIFTFNVKDIHSVLEVTVYDEDRDKKVEFLGMVAIPLLRMRPREKKWYALKDRKLIHRTKGSIQLEFDFIYNHIKAAVRTVNPKEEKFMQPEPKFKISVMKRNIDRVTSIISTFIEGGKFINSCFNWDSPIRSLTAFLVFLVIVWIFEPYMLPLTLVVLLLKNILMSSIQNTYSKDPDADEYEEEEDDFDTEDDPEKEDKKSFREKLQAAQEICLKVQEGLDMVASFGERVKNTFMWSVPWLTSLAVIALSAGVVILYFIPIRYLILAWGINKFTKKLRAPHAIPNNELLDFLSRVPSDREI